MTATYVEEEIIAKEETTLAKEFDQTKAEAFAEKILGVMNGAALALMTSIGHRTGLFDTLTSLPQATSERLADAAGMNERYVREWLGAMVTGGILEYDPADGRHTLPAAHAALLTGATSRNIGPMASSLRTLGAVLPKVERRFREGGGVPTQDPYARGHERADTMAVPGVLPRRRRAGQR